jgi:hypothetical protein
MKAVIVIVLVVLLLTGVVQASKMWKATIDLQTRAEHYLDFVDENSFDSVKKDLVSDASKMGIDLPVGNIEIEYKDTEQQTLAQKLVGGKIGAQFTNKLVHIGAHYTAHILLIPVTQTVSASHIRQVAAPVLPPNKATQELLDSNPQ